MNAHRNWIDVATREGEASSPIESEVEGLCPLVRRIASGDKFSTCKKDQHNHPGLVNVMSKVNWKENGKVLSKFFHKIGFVKFGVLKSLE